MFLIVWLWYCFDDWLSEVLGPGHYWVGHVPWVVVLVVGVLWSWLTPGVRISMGKKP